jgi:predicted ABC-type transport system involved in lysophospholipase L1 biosynthesis ATPase subunit
MIEVACVSKSYESPAGPVTVLRDLDLKVGAAETVGLS